jgi:hypothetical protein
LEARQLLSIVPAGPEFLVNAYTPGGQFWPSVAMDAAGNFLVVWSGDGADEDLYGGVFARRFDATGAAIGDQFHVNTYTTGYQVVPTAAMDANGDFVIAWRSDEQDGSAGGVYAQRFNSAGAKQGGEFRVNTYTTNNQEAPRIAMDPEGDFVIAWNSYYQDGSNNGIYAQRYDAAGAKQGGEFRVNTYTTGSQRFADITMDSDGNFVIAWASYSGSQGGGTYAQDYSASGVPRRTEFRVTSTWGLLGRFHGVAMDADGEFVVAFEGGAQRFNSSHLPAGDPIVVNSGEWIDVAMDTDGDFAITWESLGADGSSRGVYAQGFDASGVPLEADFRVNTYTTGNQFRQSIAMDADGDLVIAWASDLQDGSSFGIYAQRYAVVPEVSASSFLFDTAPHRLSFSFDRDVSASLGPEDLLVQNQTSSQSLPAADFSVSYDFTTNVAAFTYIGSGESTAGVLPDGDYRATLLAAGISTPQGASLVEDYSFDFFVLAGDADHDRDVDVNDLGILATNWQQSPRTFSQGDFDYSGTVDVTDLGILASHWQQQLAPSSAPFASRSSSSRVRAKRVIESVF